MKRFISIAIAAALLGQAVVIFAQDSGEPSEQSVLEAARAKYWASKDADQGASAQEAPEAQAAPSAEQAPQEQEAPEESSGTIAKTRDENFPYTPFLLSFVPGISVPFGTYDVSFAGGMIACVVNDVQGVEGSGVFNMANDVRGLQGAGIFNMARDLRGLQGAGIFNIARNASGAQGAGIFNIADDVHGIQGAGIFNIADSVHGFQGAGLFNIAGDVSGGQAAGLFNSAGNVKGVQIGVVNFARNIDGVQIGLVNIAGNGVDSLSFAYEPATSYAYAYWQAGTPALYTVAGVGAPYTDWSCDYSGAVASLGLGSRSHFLGITIDVDVSAEEEIGSLPFDSFDWSGDWSAWEGWSMMRPYHSLRISAGVPIGHHWQVFAGLKADIDVDALGDRVPEALKKGSGWRSSLFDEGFTVWPKWFFGLKI
jgi:hypothetical protein